MTDGADTVYVVERGDDGRQKNNVHTDPECNRLAVATTATETPRDAVDDSRICSYCAGDHDSHQTGFQANETRRRLLDMDPEELGLSPMGEQADAEVDADE